MFRGGDHALALYSFGKRASEYSDVIRIFAETAHVDHGICRVVVDVENRRVDMVDSDRASLASGDDAHSTSEIRIAGCGDCHRPREVRRIFETHADAGLGVE